MDHKTERLMTCGNVTAAFAALWLVCRLLRDIYLFGWAIQNGRGLLVLGWVLALSMGAFGLRLLAYFVTLGNVVGVFFGQFFGDFWTAWKVARLPPDPSAPEYYLAHSHPGAFLWMIAALVFLLAGLVLTLWQRHKRRREQTK